MIQDDPKWYKMLLQIFKGATFTWEDVVFRGIILKAANFLNFFHRKYGKIQGMSISSPSEPRLETALTDLGMQLDLRLQRNNGLRLRITERCDGMLACFWTKVIDKG